jgi:hypothetical protein
MSEASNKSRPDLDAARAAIQVKGAPPATEIAAEERPDGTTWDKAAPTRPPGDKGVQFPPHLKDVAGFFNEIIQSESFLLELCFDRTMDMVADAVNHRLVGTDNFQGDGDGQLGGPFTPAHYAGIAAPMTVELYKSVITAVGAREDEYKVLVKKAHEWLKELTEEATRVRQKSPIGKSGIIIP